MTDSANDRANGGDLQRSLLVERDRLQSEIRGLRQDIEAKEMACRAKENRLGHVEALLTSVSPTAGVTHKKQGPANARSTATAQLLDMAEQILRERAGEPMHYRELAEEVLRRGAVIGGKDAAGSLVARMTQDDKGKAEDEKRFVRPTSRGFYALRADYPNARNVGARRRRQNQLDSNRSNEGR